MNTQVQHNVQTLLQDYWNNKYQAYKRGEEIEEEFLQHSKVDRDGAVPEAVKEAIQYYYENVEKRDVGVVRLYQLSVENTNVFVVRTTTDGDDGWVELFNENGESLGVGRTYIELVAWDEPEALRAQTQNGEYPAQLDTASTLWK